MKSAADMDLANLDGRRLPGTQQPGTQQPGTQQPGTQLDEAGLPGAQLDWPALHAALREQGHASTPPLLAPEACAALAGLFEGGAAFRSEIDMARHGFGRGRYKYFDYPLPPLVQALRAGFYRGLAPLARLWTGAAYPSELEDYLAQCHAAGQTRPTPLLLRYEAGDYNRLHRDLYGAMAFPLQAVLLLDHPGVDFEGGEFVLVENRPRMQSKASVIALQQGQALIFAVDRRPLSLSEGRAGSFAALRHGVSKLHRGHRRTLGLIFHDAA